MEEIKAIDIHCHPALKRWVFKSHIYNPWRLRWLRGVLPHMIVNLPDMEKGIVKAAVSVYYLPEAPLKKNFISRFIPYWVFKIFNPLIKIDNILEDTRKPGAPFDQIKDYIGKFEVDVAEANKRGFNAIIAKNFGDFKKYTEEKGKIVFINSIEGANCLGTKEISYLDLEANLKSLIKDYGVCQFTLGHFFENILVSSQGGIPPNFAKLINYEDDTLYPSGHNGKVAENIIKLMLEEGVIIDLVHTHKEAKVKIYEWTKKVNEDRKAKGQKIRPLVFSHTGVLEVAKNYFGNSMPPRDQDYLPNAEDIRKIKDCNGLLGILFMDYWLEGKETHKDDPTEVILETIEFIRKTTDSDGKNSGTYDHIAIGSDWDGFSEVPNSLMSHEKLPKLIDRMRSAGIAEENIKKMCWGNYMRVLENGWGK